MNSKLKHCLIVIIFLINNSAFAQLYNRIISLAPSITESIIQLGAQNKLVGCTNYCKISNNSNIAIVATAISLNIEKIVALKPDLVIASTLTSPKDIKLIEKFGIKVLALPKIESFNDLTKEYKQIGNIVNNESKAIEILSQANLSIQKIKELNKKHKKHNLFIQIGANPLFTVIPNTFMDDYIKLCNCSNIAFDFKSGAISREAVIARNPEYIFIVSMGIVSDEEKSIWQKHKAISAVKSNNIYMLDADLACTPNPISFVKTLEIISEIINKNND